MNPAGAYLILGENFLLHPLFLWLLTDWFLPHAPKSQHTVIPPIPG
jgi:hypothetical protein